MNFTDKCNTRFSHFEPVSEEEVRRIIISSKATTCPLDSIPTALLKEFLDELLPTITILINNSLSLGVFPSTLKQAVVKPLLKKNNLDKNDLKNYRPVSNLSFLSKIYEKVVLKQIFKYINSHQLLPHNQSAYRSFHSTETAILKVANDILLALDKGEVSILALMDLSSAFDTVDHEILFETLSFHFGITNLALLWFKSYLSNRTQTVIIDGEKSKSKQIHFGVPQGSVLGPVLFLMYTKPLLILIEQQNINNQSFADDTQLYKSSNALNISNSINDLELCINVIKEWMTNNKLKLNDNKTESLLFHSQKSFVSSPKPDHIKVGSSCIYFSSSARNLGFLFSDDMSLNVQITHLCTVAYAAIRQISTIRQYLNITSTKVLVCAFVLSRLDYCNSLLYNCPQYLINKLQKVQNSAARLVMKVKKTDHIKPILKSLHWLPIKARIDYKIAILVHNFFSGIAPHYISTCLEVYHPNRNLRSSTDNRILTKIQTKTKLGDRSFSSSAPAVWNSLPYSIRHISTLESFKKSLKTHLFQKFFET